MALLFDCHTAHCEFSTVRANGKSEMIASLRSRVCVCCASSTTLEDLEVSVILVSDHENRSNERGFLMYEERLCAAIVLCVYVAPLCRSDHDF